MSPASRTAVLICGRDRTESERCVEKVLRFFGIGCRTIEPGQVPGVATEGGYAALVSAARLAELVKANGRAGWPSALGQARAVFVFGFDRSESSRALLRSLTGQPDSSIEPSAGRSVTVTASEPGLCGALSGIDAEGTAGDGAMTFVGTRAADGFRPLLTAGSGAVFFECRSNGVQVFVSAEGPALDIDRPVDGNAFDVRTCFNGVVPLIIFLKHQFADLMPTNTAVPAAFIVDDPVLKRRRYGFLDFKGVLASMERHGFATTIAFIPWNWSRTNPRTADIFLRHPERYSLVVHGCDHTSHEFGTSSVAALNHKLKLARDRVDRHFQRSGVRVSPIMVFPQGVFSPEAAYALKCNNFTAAVNTEVNPVGGAPHTEVRELWDVAIMKYHSFPVFTRRYMSHGLANFAFDAFLGKPCLLVAHHEVFKDGGRELVAFIDSLNRLSGGLRWGGLESAVHRSFSSQLRSGAWSVEMFANEMVLENPSTEPRTAFVSKRESDAGSVKRVTAEGRDLEWVLRDGRVTFRAEVPPGRWTTIAVEYVDRLGPSQSHESAKYKIRVGARRYMSELRDDYVSRSEILNACAGRVLRFLR